MIKGIGLDIVEIERIQRLEERSPKFSRRILTEQEQILYSNYTAYRRTEFLSGRFSAKEAFSKALGTGIGDQCSFLDIEVLKGNNGEPKLMFKGEPVNGYVSITHTKTHAAAQVILLND
ncbi:holo-ACP synthase [Chungangia koreensis]|uniref:Holo-[acyl-carrier-protein] synthase n=1 Tax=Chungangia koreensis TaxID=752657 RepID=A0ABV8X8B4_9LACT